MNPNNNHEPKPNPNYNAYIKINPSHDLTLSQTIALPMYA